MKKTAISVVIAMPLILFVPGALAAVKVVECEDNEGNRTFAKTCPTGYSVISEKKLSISKGSSGKEEDEGSNYESIAATMYAIKEGCAACDSVKNYLDSLGVNINIIYIEDDLEQQNKLNELAGELRVPYTIIGENQIKGFSLSKFESAVNEEAQKN